MKANHDSSSSQLDADSAAMLCLQHDPGNGQAFNGIWERWHEKVWKRARFLTGTEEAADEATQLTFARVFEDRDGFEPAPGNGFARWIYTIVRYASFKESYARQKAKTNVHALEKKKKGLLDKEAPTPEEEAQLEWVHEVLDRIDPMLKQVYLLRVVEEQTFKEIGLTLGLPQETAHYRFKMAERALEHAGSDPDSNSDADSEEENVS